MKNTTLLFAFYFATLPMLSAQVIFSEDFTSVASNSVPANWQVSRNTDVHDYEKPYACLTDKGMQTPGVGKDAPTRFILPKLTYNSINGIIKITFEVFVMDPNLKCNTVKPFPCPTYVHVMLIHDTYRGGTNSLPSASDIFSEQTYLISIANGSNTIIFNHPAIDSTYQIYFDFKTAENTNCTSTGTKFVFDNFVVDQSPCTGNCPPVANDDYFDGNTQEFDDTVRANVYGGYLLWSSEGRTGYEMRSLPFYPAVNNGVDYDVNNHILSDMDFVMIGTETVVTNTSCSSGPYGQLTWNGDGSFEYIRLKSCVEQVTFRYKIIDPTDLSSDTALVTIDFKAAIILPVKLTSFTAIRKADAVQLDWETSMEYQTEGFYVQRNTGDGWMDLGFVPVQKTSTTTTRKYSFTDANYFIGIRNYRLKIVDIDGYTEYSMIRTVRTLENTDVLIYPNPSRNGEIKVELPAGGNYSIEIFGLNGAKLATHERINESLFTIRNLKPGVYMMRIMERSGAVITTSKLVVL